jgi:hypothetical protein
MYAHHEKTISMKRNSERKSTDRKGRHTLRGVVSKNHRTAAQMATELNIDLDDRFHKI